MIEYITASYSSFLKIDGELLLSLTPDPRKPLFNGEKVKQEHREILLYKNTSGEFILNQKIGLDSVHTQGFKSLLTALFYCHKLSESPKYFELLDKEGELKNSDRLRLETIGEYSPDDLEVLYIQTTEAESEESEEVSLDDIECAFISNAKAFFQSDNVILARKNNAVQMVLIKNEVVETIAVFALTQTNIAQTLPEILELIASKISPVNFHLACKALVQAIGTMGLSVPQNTNIPESSFAALGLTEKEVFINQKPSADELDSYSGHTGIDGVNIAAFKIHGKLVAQTTYQNMDYFIYVANGGYVLVEQSTNQINQKVYAYTRAFRFYGFNHNTLAGSLEINLPKEVCSALQQQLCLPSDQIVHGVLSPNDPIPFACKVYVGNGKEIYVIGKPLTAHETVFAKIGTFISYDCINLLIILKNQDKAEMNVMYEALPSFFSISDIKNKERIANFEDAPYLCISSKHEADFFGILSMVFNPALVIADHQGLIKANTNDIYEFIEKHNLLPPKRIYTH